MNSFFYQSLEQIRRKDALVKQALAEKEDLVADMLAIPREHFEHIADMASAAATNAMNSHTSDITDRLLASVFQVRKRINNFFKQVLILSKIRLTSFKKPSTML